MNKFTNKLFTFALMYGVTIFTVLAAFADEGR
jgi:hypothetical protein